MKDVQDWARESAFRLFGKRPSSPVDLASIIESTIGGKDIESERGILILPEGWESQFRDWIDQAGRQGNTKRKEELEALRSFFSFSGSVGKSREDILAQVEEIRRLCHKPVSTAVQSFVLGSLGPILVSHGFNAAIFATDRRGGSGCETERREVGGVAMVRESCFISSE